VVERRIILACNEDWGSQPPNFLHPLGWEAAMLQEGFGKEWERVVRADAEPVYTLIRQPVTYLGLVFAIVSLTVLLAKSHAAENCCPGSPRNCVPAFTCPDITWCVDDPGQCNGFLQPNFGYKKYFIIKVCHVYNQPGDACLLFSLWQPTTVRVLYKHRAGTAMSYYRSLSIAHTCEELHYQAQAII
jgi:hypothetical protein